MEMLVKQEEVTIFAPDGSEARQKTVTFQFDPTKIELVRAKDGAYIVRNRRPRSVATFQKAEGEESVQSS